MMSGINALGPPRFHYRGLIIQASECLYTPLKLGLDFFLLGQHHMQARGGTYRETKKHKSLRLAVTRSGGSD